MLVFGPLAINEDNFFLLFWPFFQSSLCCKREAFWIANYGFNLIVKFQIRAGKRCWKLPKSKIEYLCNFKLKGASLIYLTLRRLKDVSGTM
jgi:hypothetical protein